MDRRQFPNIVIWMHRARDRFTSPIDGCVILSGNDDDDGELFHVDSIGCRNSPGIAQEVPPDDDGDDENGGRLSALEQIDASDNHTLPHTGRIKVFAANSIHRRRRRMTRSSTRPES